MNFRAIRLFLSITLIIVMVLTAIFGYLYIHDNLNVIHKSLTQKHNTENVNKNPTQSPKEVIKNTNTDKETQPQIKISDCKGDNCTQDTNNLEELFKSKTKSCNSALKEKNIKNTCEQKSDENREKCVQDLTQKSKDVACCYLMTNKYTDLNNYKNKVAINKCEMNYIIDQKTQNLCFDTIDPKECFVCFLRNNHMNVFENSICTGLKKDQKEFCNSALFFNFDYCNKIQNPSLKDECLKTDVSQNNCIYYNSDKPNKGKNTRKTDITEILQNTESKMYIYQKQKVDKNKINYLEKQNNAYTFSLNEDINPNVELPKCKLDTKSISIDYDNSKYSTFYFTYKNYQFVYSIKVFDDFYNYSEELAREYCYPFDGDKSYDRYLKDKYNNAIVQRIESDFNSLQKHGFNKNEIAEIIVRFVQQIPYNYDWGKTNVYPYSVIWDMKGVCLDKSVLLAELLKDFGYETYIITGIKYENGTGINHALVGVTCDNSNLVYNNKEICVIESTSPSLINENMINNKMQIFKISDGRKYVEDSYGPLKAKELKQDEAKMKILKQKIEAYSKASNWKEYNKLVVQYNSLLYRTKEIRFSVYE